MRDYVGTWRLWAYAFGIIVCGAAVTFAMHRLTGMSIPWAISSNIVVLPLGAAAVVLLLQRCFAVIPRRVETVGDLAREAAGFAFSDLRQEKKGYGPPDLWFALTAILRQISGRKGPIDRQTTFFARQAPASSK